MTLNAALRLPADYPVSQLTRVSDVLERRGCSLRGPQCDRVRPNSADGQTSVADPPDGSEQLSSKLNPPSLRRRIKQLLGCCSSREEKPRLLPGAPSVMKASDAFYSPEGGCKSRRNADVGLDPH